MTGEIQIKLDQAQLTRVYSMLSEIKNGPEKAIVKAINTTLTKLKTEASKIIRAKVALKKAKVDEFIELFKANYEKISGSMRLSGSRIGAIHYGARQTAQGITIKIKTAGPRSLVAHGFLANVKKSGNAADVQAYRRKYTGPRAKWNKNKPYAKMPKLYRFPIEKITGPSIPEVAGYSEVLSQIMGAASVLFVARLEYETNEVLRRAKL